MEDSTEAQSRIQFILASAYYHAPPPTEVVRANCARVLRHALMAAGLWNKQLNKNESALFHGDENALAQFPVVNLWYATLIELTLKEPHPERLLNGGGNLALPAGAFFTACWLTPVGRITAEKLLREHPEWEVQLNPRQAGV